MGRKVVGNGSASGRQWVSKQKKGLSSAPKVSLHWKYLYIKKTGFIPRNLPTVFLNPGKEDDSRGNPTPYLDTREFFVKPAVDFGYSHLEKKTLLWYPSFLLIPSETLFFGQTFEMKLRKNDVWLTVNRLGSPTPF